MCVALSNELKCLKPIQIAFQCATYCYSLSLSRQFPGMKEKFKKITIRRLTRRNNDNEIYRNYLWIIWFTCSISLSTRMQRYRINLFIVDLCHDTNQNKIYDCRTLGFVFGGSYTICFKNVRHFMEKSLKQLLTSSWNIFASSSPMVRLSESSLSTLLVSSLSDSITVNSKCSWSFSASPSASASASALLSASPSPDVLLTSLFSVSGFSFSVSSSFSSVSSSAFFDASSSSSPPFACYTTTKSIIKMCLLHFSQIQFKTCFSFLE